VECAALVSPPRQIGSLGTQPIPHDGIIRARPLTSGEFLRRELVRDRQFSETTDEPINVSESAPGIFLKILCTFLCLR
jgi:hypothetical protein